tara:strand:- start:756 stop:1229 length:474 start_codon:yes stop_codon:yes gene_type:complete
MFDTTTILVFAFIIQIASLVFQCIQTVYVNECSDTNLIITPLVASIVNGVSFLTYGMYKYLEGGEQKSLEYLENMLALGTLGFWVTNTVTSSIAWGQAIHYDVTCPTLNKDVDVRLLSVLSTSFFLGSLLVFMIAKSDVQMKRFLLDQQRYERVRRF